MAFGRRATEPRAHPSNERGAGIARRGGYPLGVLAVAVSSLGAGSIMTFIPHFNPTSRPVGEVVEASVMAVLNITVIAAIVLLIVDSGLRALKVSAVWAYALAGGALTFGICFLLASALASDNVSPAFVAMMVLLPSAIGGSVLGLFRTGP